MNTTNDHDGQDDLYDQNSDQDDIQFEGHSKQSIRKTILQEFIRKNIEKIEEEIKKEKITKSQEEFLSMQELLASDGTSIIQDPREYQVELFEKAKKANIIAVLPTGSGKTLISVLLLRHILDLEVINRDAGLPPKYAFFLVHTTTLVFQQYNVLDRNLDHEILKLCGADKVDNWSEAVWQKHLQGRKVIVCTGAILVNCIRAAYLNMNQINLLIFDEAHHAKGDDQFALLMRNFYHRCPIQDRPKVFGMTASPVDSKTDIDRAASDLQKLLDAKIVTVPSSSLEVKKLSGDDTQLIASTSPFFHLNTSNEFNEYYARLEDPRQTGLSQALDLTFGLILRRELNSLFHDSLQITSQLGYWAAEYLWKICNSEYFEKNLESRIEKRLRSQKNDHSVKKKDDELTQLKKALELINNHNYGIPCLGQNISSAVASLHKVLQPHFDRPTQAKCIVFVEKRSTAVLLNKIFQHEHIGGKFLKPASLVGVGEDKKIGVPCPTYKEQIIRILGFRKGELNCLFATSIAEEGLDVPECNLVVRFDLYKTMIQYVQSKGRARKKGSKFIHLLEEGNLTHRIIIEDAKLQADKMNRWCMRSGQRHVLSSIDNDWDASTFEGYFKIIDQKTKAEVTPETAIQTINHFVAKLPNNTDVEIQPPQYIVSGVQGRFICDLVMPVSSPVGRCLGLEQRNKGAAKRSAAMEMVRILKEKKLLNNRFLPEYQKVLPLFRNANLHLSEEKKDSYPRLVKPSLWTTNETSSLPCQLFMTVIDVEGSFDRPHQPLAILTKKPLQDFDRFILYLLDDLKLVVFTKAFQNPIDVDENFLRKLTKLFLVVLKDVFHKEYEEDVYKMPYWIVPLNKKLDHGEGYHLDYDSIDRYSITEELKWSSNQPKEFYKNKFIFDPYEGGGGKRYISIEVDESLKPTDQIPEGTPDKGKCSSIMNYSALSLYRSSQKKQESMWDLNQPVIKTTRISLRRNLFSKPTTKEHKFHGVPIYICPQPLRISRLDVAFVTMCLAFPSIIHRIEESMIVLEACAKLHITLPPSLALEAFTKDTQANNLDHSHNGHPASPVPTTTPTGPNYERLEFIGDTFLKLATTIALFAQRPDKDEFDAHVERMLMLCNRNLFVQARALALAPFVRSVPLDRGSWYPPGLALLRGRRALAAPRVPVHRLSDKTLADVCEAVIGGAFVHGAGLGDEGRDGVGRVWERGNWDAAVRAVSLFVDSENHRMVRWDEYRAAYKVPAYQTACASAVHRELAAVVGRRMGYVFRYPRLLASAFQHPSNLVGRDGIPSYQRLEFLGDALLDVAVVSHLFHTFPDKDPQWLSEHKTAMVSNKFLGALSVKLGFHKHLRHFSASIEALVRSWVEEIEQVEESATVNGVCSMDYWINASEPPKCLPDIVESYIGAIFIDSDFDYNPVLKFFNNKVRPYFENMSLYSMFAKNHPISLFHHGLSVEMFCRDYALMSMEIPPNEFQAKDKLIAVVMIHDRIVKYCIGEGSRYSKIRVCQKFNEEIEGMAPIDFRTKYGCTCSLEAFGDYASQTDVKSGI